jgi:fructan beta-fructosidase
MKKISRRIFIKQAALTTAATFLPVISGARNKKGIIEMSQTYNEKHRPQFHFSAKEGWLNDPNGLVYYDGTYHLFFQHNPEGNNWGNMTWGHAVSKDLVHWEQLENAIEPDELGTIFSGSAVVDWENSSGLGTDGNPPLAAFFTYAGAHAEPKTQALAYSNDKGMTWTKYDGNPVIQHINLNNRDPKVIWHAGSKKWVMALYLDGDEYLLLHSNDLKEWHKFQVVYSKDGTECPDFFPLELDGEEKWVFWTANTEYLVGSFDGEKFEPEGEHLRAGIGTDYAAQTWSDISKEDGRRIQISWVRGGNYPGMPFNQQMSFPQELCLKKLPEGIRLCRAPIREIEQLYVEEHKLNDLAIKADGTRVVETKGDLFDVSLELAPGAAKELGLRVRGHELCFKVEKRTLSFSGQQLALELREGMLKLRLLVDRTSLEVFIGEGEKTLTACFLPDENAPKLELFARGGEAKAVEFVVNELKSAW